MHVKNTANAANTTDTGVCLYHVLQTCPEFNQSGEYIDNDDHIKYLLTSPLVDINVHTLGAACELAGQRGLTRIQRLLVAHMSGTAE